MPLPSWPRVSSHLALGVAIGLLASAVISTSSSTVISTSATVVINSGAVYGHLASVVLALAIMLSLRDRHRRLRMLSPEAGKVDESPSKSSAPASGTCVSGCCDHATPQLKEVKFTINGAARTINLEGSSASTMLLSTYLREHERLTGVKVSCREGGCGACTVLLRLPHEDHAVPINSCLRLLAACDGCALTTIEGIGTSAKPHPFQAKLAAANGSQCGFCSPGMVAAIVGLLEQTPKGSKPTSEQVEHALDGNLCRCTGYRKILEAAQELVASGQATPLDAVHHASRTACDGAAKGEPADGGKGKAADSAAHTHPNGHGHVEDIEDLVDHMCRADDKWTAPTDATDAHARKEARKAAARRGIKALAARTGPRVPLPPTAAVSSMATSPAPSTPAVYMPTTLKDAAMLVAATPKARVVGANSGHVGVSKYYDGRSSGAPEPPPPPALIIVERVAEMTKVDEAIDGTLTLGAALPLATLLNVAETRSGAPPHRDGERWAAFARHLHRVANNQVRSVGTLGGNLMLAHAHGLFPSDIALLLSAVGAHLCICDCASLTTTDVTLYDFFALDMTSKLLVELVLPPPPPTSTEYFFSFKTALRSQNAHAIVNAAVAICVNQPPHAAGGVGVAPVAMVTSARVCYGGLKPHEVTDASAAATALVGSALGSDAALKRALAALEPVVSSVDPVFGRTTFRQTLVRTLLFKGVLRACKAAGVATLPLPLASASTGYIRPISSGSESVQGAENPAFYPVSKPTAKLTEIEQCTGETAYTDDAPRAAGQLFGAFALAHTNGVLRLISTDQAAAAAGVAKVLTAIDLTSAGLTLSLSKYNDEAILISIDEKVPHAGARLALVCATSREAAEHAARLVVAAIDPPSQPVVVEFDEAIATRRYFDQKAGTLRKGDAPAAIKSADVVVRGEVECGHQYHFYMETQTASAQKDGAGGMVITVATQAPSDVASTVARVLGLDDTQVEAKMVRAGGGYGGKGSRSIPCAVGAACAAWLLDGPVAIALDLNSNMAMLGSRRPHRLEYTVGAAKDGTIVGVEGTTWSIQVREISPYLSVSQSFHALLMPSLHVVDPGKRQRHGRPLNEPRPLFVN